VELEGLKGGRGRGRGVQIGVEEKREKEGKIIDQR
jgi:hypothetical protein